MQRNQPRLPVLAVDHNRGTVYGVPLRLVHGLGHVEALHALDLDVERLQAFGVYVRVARTAYIALIVAVGGEALRRQVGGKLPLSGAAPYCT